MANLLIKGIGGIIVQRIRDLYSAVFMQFWWIPCAFLSIVPLIRIYGGFGISLGIIELLLIVFALVSMTLSRQRYVHKNFYEIITINQFVIAVSWLVICLAIIVGLHLPFSFRELLPHQLQQMPLLVRICVELCTLGVSANIFVLWLYKFLEYSQQLTLKNYISICITSFLQTLMLIRHNPTTLIIFALNSLIVDLAHFGLVTFFDWVAFAAQHPWDSVLLPLRIWVPFVVLIPVYTAITAVVYENITTTA